MNAEEIIEAMVEHYATLPTYVDRGEVVSRGYKYQSDELTDESRLEFRTIYRRPTEFYFEFAEGNEAEAEDDDTPARMILWSDGAHVRAYWEEMSQVDEHDDLDLAIAAFTGISNGAAGVVPYLLRGSEELSWISGLTNLELLEPEEVDGHRCYVVKASGDEPMTIQFWIDTEHFLLRRLLRQQELSDQETRELFKEVFDEMKAMQPTEEADELRLVLDALGSNQENVVGSREETIITWHPMPNAPVSTELFQFEPPL